MPLLARIGAALNAFASPVQKGSITPFDRIPVISAGGSVKLNRPFEQSVWVMRAIKEISGPIAAAELKFYDGDTEIMDAPWLPFWRKPARNLILADFIEALVGWLKLSGEAFILLQPEFSAPFPDVRRNYPPLMLARPESMTAIKTDAGELIAWEYKGPKGQRLKFPPEQVIQPRYWNPYDELRGMSEYEAACVATEADYLAGKFALNLSRANGDTGVIVSVKAGASLDDMQQKQITDSLRLKQQRSQRGEFSSIFVPADLEVQDPKVRAPDAQFVAQRLENRHEIYIAFGVPPSMADVVASYSVGSASDWYRLITGTCIPTACKIADAISQVASRMHGSPVEAYFEFDEHPVMQTVRRERVDAGTKLWDRGMPWKDASEYLDLDLPKFEGDDIGYISFGLAPVGQSAPDAKTDPALAEPDAVQEALRAVREMNTKHQTPNTKGDCDCCGIDFANLAIRAGDSHDVKLWKSHMAKRRESIRAYESKFNRVLITARAEVLKKIDNAILTDPDSGLRTPDSGLLNRAAAADFMFNLANLEKMFQAQMRAAGLNALQKAGDQAMTELGKDDPWTMPQAEALNFVANRQNKLGGVPQDVFDKIKNEITDGLTNGDPLKKIADAVRAQFNEISARRGMTIASTETAAAYGTARQLAMKDAGIEWKKWLTSGNSNVRPSHRMMNQTIVRIDEMFTVIDPKTGNVDKVLHPADPKGKPWNVINCHCLEVATANGPEGIAEPTT